MKLFLCSKYECQLAISYINKVQATGVSGFLTVSVDGYLLLLANGIQNVEYVSANVPRYTLPQAVIWADHSARMLDHEVTSARSLDNAKQNVMGWEYQHKRMFAFHFILTREFSKYINLKSLPRELLFLDMPESYSIFRLNIHSLFWRSFLLKENKILHFIKVNKEPEDWRLHPKLPNELLERNFETLVYLPGTYYDLSNLRKRFGHGAVIDIQSPQFDLQINAARVSLLQTDDSHCISTHPGSLNLKISQAYEDFINTLGESSNPWFFRQLKKSWLERASFQSGLSEFLFNNKVFESIKFIAISEICGGCHAPVLAFSKVKNISTEIIPHSNYIHTPIDLSCRVNIKSTLSLRSSYHSLSLVRNASVVRPSVAKSRYGEAKRTNVNNFQYSLGILMNQFDQITGFSLTQPNRLFKFLGTLSNTLSTRGFTCAIRVKPDNEYIKRFFDKRINVDSNRFGLDDFISSSGVVLSLLAPTNAMNRAWELGKACIHLQETAMSVFEQGHMPEPDVDVMVIDTGFDESAISKIVNFLEERFASE